MERVRLSPLAGAGPPYERRWVLQAIVGSMLLLLAPALCLSPQYPAVASSGAEILVESELFVRDPRVVDDDRAYDGGAWSFGEMMRRLAGSRPGDQFAEDWIDTLVDRPVVNGDVSLGALPAMASKDTAFSAFFDAWRDRSAGPLVDLDSAPFRLLAIVHRPDLLRLRSGELLSGGEARLIFSAVDPGEADVRSAENSLGQNFFVIFEFQAPVGSCGELIAWQERWHDLAHDPAAPLGTPGFNAALQSITDAFTLPDLTSGQPNGSPLAQLRTNEFQLIPGLSTFWDMREWHLIEPAGQPGFGSLVPSITAQSPGYRFVKFPLLRQELGDWLRNHRTEILAGTHLIPKRLPSGQPFAGGIAINERILAPLPPDNNPSFGKQPEFGPTEWWAPGFASNLDASTPFLATAEDALVRHGFAMQTCAGCHGIETGTDGVVQDPLTGHAQSFSMTKPRLFGEATKLSPFLTGTGKFPDRVNPRALDAAGEEVGIWHEFNDLERRATVMRRLLQLDAASPDALSVLREIANSTGSRVH